MDVVDSDSASSDRLSRASTPSGSDLYQVLSAEERCVSICIDSVAGPDRKKQKRKRDLFTVSLDDQDEIVTYTDKEHGVTYKAGGEN